MRIEIVKLTLGNDALTNGTFIVMIEDRRCAMGPSIESIYGLSTIFRGDTLYRHEVSVILL